MRNGVRDRLINQIVEIGGRVFEPEAAMPTTPKPYLVVVVGVDTEESEWAGFRRIIEVWPYLDRTKFETVDDMARDVVAALDSQLLTDPVTGEKFTCVFIGNAGEGDVVDDTWGIITRGLRFMVLGVHPVATNEVALDDSWLTALATWTDGLLNPDPLNKVYGVYKNAWPADYKAPAVLWRLAKTDKAPKTAKVYEVTKTFVGHVIGTPNTRRNTADAIEAGAFDAIKIVLDAENRRYMKVVDCETDLRADPMTGGQLALTLSRNVSRAEAAQVAVGTVVIEPTIS